MSLFEKLDDSNGCEFNDVVSYQLIELLKKNIDFLSLIIPIGQIGPIITNIVGVPDPDQNIFQLCDGSEITNENSPLKSIGINKRYTPNMKDRFLKIPTGIGASGTLTGQSTINLSHDHGGYTTHYNGIHNIDHDDTRREALKHRHTVPRDFINPVNIEPPYYTLKFYMRIQ